MTKFNKIALLERSNFIQKIILQSNKIAKSIFIEGCDTSWKKDHTPVTKLDIDLEELIYKNISLVYPADGCIGEKLIEKKIN